jgi:hypothetical protein
MHNAIMVEFGDSHADAPVQSETSWEAVMPVELGMPAAIAEDDNALVEFQPQLQVVENSVE